VQVYWLVRAAKDLPEDDDWLTAGEVARLRELRVAKRRRDWLLGRWTAKQAIVAAWPSLAPDTHQPSLSEVEVRPASDGAPEALVRGERAGFTVSISHSSNSGLCAVSPLTAQMGCDIELIEVRSDRFIEDYFTEDEGTEIFALPATKRPMAATLVWSAKESALKATREGLRSDTRAMEVDPGRYSEGREWCPLLVRHRDGRIFPGQWRCYGEFVLTVVADREIGLTQLPA
jgi:4'-phosphopantetheinyl transferase